MNAGVCPGGGFRKELRLQLILCFVTSLENSPDVKSAVDTENKNQEENLEFQQHIR